MNKVTKNELVCDCIDNEKSIFNTLPEKDKNTLKKHHACIAYKKNEVIFKAGDTPIGLTCLSQGKVKVFKEGIGGKEQIVRLAKPVGFIGYRAIFADELHTATAVALEDSVVCRIEKDTLFKVLKSNGELAMNIIKAFATELGFSNDRTVKLTQKHIRGRLADSLIFLKDTYGVEKDQSLKVLLSREDIANLSNMTTSNAIRTLSSFSSENIIAIEGRRIRILDMYELERISEIG